MTTLLILTVLVLGLLVVLRLSRVADLTRELRGLREERITERENRISGRLMWAFGAIYLILFTWMPIHFHEVFLPPAASTQGVLIDQLYDINWVVLGIVFFGTNIALFWFAGKYYHRDGKRAYWYPHNDKLEMIWTIVPTIVLVAGIIYGIIVWNRITAPVAPGTMQVEMYSKQFDWTFRYPGKDGKLGATDFRLITSDNPLGIVTRKSLSDRLATLKQESAQATADREAQAATLPTSSLEDRDADIAHINRMIERLMGLQKLMEDDIKANGANSAYMHGADDKVTKEFHLPVDTDVELLMRSQDVIHSAYLPHMRAQMNTVPGMTTRMHLKPTITTDSMRVMTNNPEFDYILMCNKVCGISHYNMQAPLTVEAAGAFKVWNIMLPVFEKAGSPAPAATAEATPAEGTEETSGTN
ncbi:MAG: cytochrome c oxidase subunit II [Flavobacteriales bacterium]|nr:cytochrome c oxidase subunit II [Flavobacteriales bacterium]MCL4281639.1 cytochrome c oxidase subunit II [Flavobacteriales bacterium]